ncbi:MAG: AMP-binding protein [Bacteroidales bacterium]|nr:AMP-binding protein [Bacteroidales bacterium]MDD3525617.1 AMP-binding protein [Bacteroidales bacterium]MDY0336006.1 AMP-binding protein [Bacteroidales bacterium]NCU36940.1 long-chain fatty acid--CoA ligase [Candidatus Falkowbacteria bacterium]NLO50010.1 long-chain fatty acid--CoA ligase [Bacteroidales bacterium]
MKRKDKRSSKNERTYLADLFSDAMKQNWEKPAFTNYGDDTLTFGEVAARIDFLHRFLKEEKISKGDKIALLGTNSAAWGIAFIGIITYGAVVVPILPDFSTENVHHIVNHSDSKILIVSSAIYERLEVDHIKTLTCVLELSNFSLLHEKGTRTAQAFQRVEQQSVSAALRLDDLRYHQGKPEDLCVISYTSGTSGFTKGVMLPQRSLYSNIIFARENMPLEAGNQIVSFLPLAHVFGLLFEFLFPFTMGCHITFLAKIPSPAIVTKAFGEIRPHLILSVPLVIEKIYKKKIVPKLDKPLMKILLKTPVVADVIRRRVNKTLTETFGGRFREIVIGGAPLSEEVETFFRKIGFRFTIGYGMTECGPLISYVSWDKSRFRSAGVVVDRMKMKIVRPETDTGIGEIVVKGSNVMLGYYKNEAADKESFTKDGWLKTGDLGYIDSDGFLYIKGRSKNMILGASGQNIYPEEIEARISNLPCVQECVVKLHKDKLVAMIYPDRDAMECGNLDFQDIETKMKNVVLKELNQDLPRFAQISDVEIVDVEFVKTPKKSIKRYLYT